MLVKTVEVLISSSFLLISEFTIHDAVTEDNSGRPRY